MPLFGRKSEPVPAQQAPVHTHNTRMSTSSRGSAGGGLFRRRRSESSVSSSDYEQPRRTSGLRSGGGLFKRNTEDPSIVAARERVLAAEQAERDADIALQQARTSVREAREHVKRLEMEAAAEAKAAKVKQGQAKNLNKRAKPLGSKYRQYSKYSLADANLNQDTIVSKQTSIRVSASEMAGAGVL